MATEIFRAGVGIAIVKNGQVLVFERVDKSGSWQMPQGGIDIGEKPAETAIRELKEETGLTAEDVRLLGEYPEWLVYEYPSYVEKGKHLGQAQRWFVYELLTDESRINLETGEYQEFSQFRWVDTKDLESIAVDFRKPIYRHIASYVDMLSQ